MKFAVGYQLSEENEEPFTDIVRDYRDHIAEVYFPWPGTPSGRSPLGVAGGSVDWSAQARLEDDLVCLKDMGVRLQFLLNANCYGGESLSKHFLNRTVSMVEHLRKTVKLDGVTTASLAIARALKECVGDLDVRASVNMRIGTVKGLMYVSDYFDSYTIQREYNRDPQRITECREWAEANGKALHILVNSGCMNFCSGQTFHDNLVAHEAEIAQTDVIEGWNPCVCWNYCAQPEHWVVLLQNSWIRPEDLHYYEDLFPIAKLATRMHANPRRVIRAYSERKYRGNVLDLFEPSHSPILKGHVIENSLFPDDWFERTTQCDKKCHRCDYCASVLKKVLLKVE